MLTGRLKKARKDKKYTQESLAKKLNTTKGTISNYENGHSTPSNEMLVMLADTLDVTVDYLLGREVTLLTLVEQSEFIESLLELLQIKEDLSNEEKDLKRRIEEYATDKNNRFFEPKLYEDCLEYSKRQKNNKDEKDIAKRMAKMKKDLIEGNADGGLNFMGEPMSEEAVESLLEALEHAERIATLANKKFTPNKYRDK